MVKVSKCDYMEDLKSTYADSAYLAYKGLLMELFRLNHMVRSLTFYPEARLKRYHELIDKLSGKAVKLTEFVKALGDETCDAIKEMDDKDAQLRSNFDPKNTIIEGMHVTTRNTTSSVVVSKQEPRREKVVKPIKKKWEPPAPTEGKRSFKDFLA